MQYRHDYELTPPMLMLVVFLSLLLAAPACLACCSPAFSEMERLDCLCSKCEDGEFRAGICCSGVYLFVLCNERDLPVSCSLGISLSLACTPTALHCSCF